MGDDPITLYGGVLSPYVARVRLFGYAKGIELNEVAPPGGMMTEEYKTHNPIGRIPSIVLYDGFVLPESQAICEYLEDRYPEPSLIPGTPEERARIRLLCQVADAYVMKGLMPFFALIRSIPLDLDRAVGWHARLVEALSHVDAFLVPGSHAAGDRITLADCALVPMLFYTDMFMPPSGYESPIGTFSRLGAYWGSIQQDPHVIRLLSEMKPVLDATLADAGGNAKHG